MAINRIVKEELKDYFVHDIVDMASCNLGVIQVRLIAFKDKGILIQVDDSFFTYSR